LQTEINNLKIGQSSFFVGGSCRKDYFDTVGQLKYWSRQIAVAAISNFLFYNPDTINLHVLMVLSIGGIANAMLLPVILFFNFYPSMHHFE
jgi:hypothetical protein